MAGRWGGDGRRKPPRYGGSCPAVFAPRKHGAGDRKAARWSAVRRRAQRRRRARPAEVRLKPQGESGWGREALGGPVGGPPPPPLSKKSDGAGPKPTPG